MTLRSGSYPFDAVLLWASQPFSGLDRFSEHRSEIPSDPAVDSPPPFAVLLPGTIRADQSGVAGDLSSDLQPTTETVCDRRAPSG
jgi:hypothetical protein